MKEQNSPIQLAVPIKPYLKKFVLFIENMEVDAAVDLSQRGLIANTFKRVLTWKNTASAGRMNADYTETIKIEIPARNWQRGNWYLNTRSIKDVNDAIAQFLHETLNFKIHMDVARGLEQKQSIEEFMDLLGIVDEVEYDALKKANQRLRDERNQVLFIRKKIDFDPTKLSTYAIGP